MADWKKQFDEIKAYWEYPGEPRAEQAHCRLTSGLCSNGFFNGTLVMQRPSLAKVACADLMLSLGQANWQQADFVFGSAMGAVNLSYQLAQNMGKLSGYTEKGDDGNMEVKRFQIEPGTKVIMCEDVITTGGTTLKSIVALEAAGAEVFPYILALVNRSGKSELDGRKIIALVTADLPVWDPDLCPYCKANSEAVRPKGRENWAKLRRQVASN